MSTNNHQKGQSSMEYLLTYDWAILGIIIALLILAVIGAFSSRPTGNSSSCDV